MEPGPEVTHRQEHEAESKLDPFNDPVASQHVAQNARILNEHIEAIRRRLPNVSTDNELLKELNNIRAALAKLKKHETVSDQLVYWLMAEARKLEKFQVTAILALTCLKKISKRRAIDSEPFARFLFKIYKENQNHQLRVTALTIFANVMARKQTWRSIFIAKNGLCIGMDFLEEDDTPTLKCLASIVYSLKDKIVRLREDKLAQVIEMLYSLIQLYPGNDESYLMRCGMVIYAICCTPLKREQIGQSELLSELFHDKFTKSKKPQLSALTFKIFEKLLKNASISHDVWVTPIIERLAQLIKQGSSPRVMLTSLDLLNTFVYGPPVQALREVFRLLRDHFYYLMFQSPPAVTFLAMDLLATFANIKQAWIVTYLTYQGFALRLQNLLKQPESEEDQTRGLEILSRLIQTFRGSELQEEFIKAGLINQCFKLMEFAKGKEDPTAEHCPLTLTLQHKYLFRQKIKQTGSKH